MNSNLSNVTRNGFREVTPSELASVEGGLLGIIIGMLVEDTLRSAWNGDLAKIVKKAAEEKRQQQK
jgi:hypothetical protein